MPSRRRILFALPPAALVVLVAAGCGGGDEPASEVTTTPTAARTATAPATTAPSTTGTTPAQPAIDPDAPLSLATAEQTLSRRGYATLSERDWRPDQPLKVLLGIREDDAGPRAELAFFFVGDRFIGTDTKDPSGQIEVVEQTGEAVTLSYALYRPADSVDDPTGGTAEVTYAWDGSRLTPQGAIPDASPDAPLSRR